jgi:hypothetical protein
VKLIVAALIMAASGGVLFSFGSARPPPPVRVGGIQLCQAGGVELVDERCNANGCAKESVRLAWDHGPGVLFEGDSTGEKELRRIGPAEVDRLLTALTAIEPMDTDRDQPCSRGRWDHGHCEEGAERVLTITTACHDSAWTHTFMGAKPVWERVRSECPGPWSPELAQCLARSSWQATFATHLAVRFGTVFHQLRDAARGG